MHNIFVNLRQNLTLELTITYHHGNIIKRNGQPPASTTPQAKFITTLPVPSWMSPQACSACISNTHLYCHILFLEYPATSLIPTSPTGRFSLRLQQPKDAAYREMPDLGKYSLQERGLDYFIRYDITQRYFQGFPQPSFIDLPSAINQLSTCGGRSVLEAVTISDNKLGDESYIFRLTTLWHPSGTHQVHNFPLSEKDWKSLTTSPSSKAWTSLFQDLFFRASDRAYFHVKRQLYPTECLSIGAQK